MLSSHLPLVATFWTDEGTLSSSWKFLLDNTSLGYKGKRNIQSGSDG